MEGLGMTAAFEKAFRGKRILVTGHTGFKGSWLCLWLNQLGAKVVGLSLPPATEPNNFSVSCVEELLAGHELGDIRDYSVVKKTIDEAAPEIIFHLAAQAIVRESYLAPRETFETNAMGTTHVLEAVRARGQPCSVVVVTSDKCYENREQLWGYREGDAMGGYDPYSASKGVAELITQSYRRSFFDPNRISSHGVKIASARAGNVIGGGDWAKDRIVVDAVLHMSKGEPIPVRNPGAVRPWQHVLEPLSGYLSLAANMESSKDATWCSGWNFGPRTGDEATVEELVTRLCQAWGEASWRDMSDKSQPHEAGILRLSVEKATWLLGWRPTWDLQQTVDCTAKWYRSYYSSHSSVSMREHSLADLDAFMASSGNKCCTP
jgi:CDP-glucose 4,6-dehydratase